MVKIAKKGKCSCPFCDAEVTVKSPVCQSCQVTIAYCTECEKPLPKNAKVCPGCGAKVKK